jgi:hypothetical protein
VQLFVTFHRCYCDFPVAYAVNGGTEVVQNQVFHCSYCYYYLTLQKLDLGPVGDYTIQVSTKLVGDTDLQNAKSITLSHVANAVTNVTGTFDGIDDYAVADTSAPVLDLSNNYTFGSLLQKSPLFFGRILIKSRK